MNEKQSNDLEVENERLKNELVQLKVLNNLTIIEGTAEYVNDASLNAGIKQRSRSI